MIPFKPYVLPRYSAYGWDRAFNQTQVESFIDAQGPTYAFQVPRYSARYQIFSHQNGAFRIYNRLGRPCLTSDSILGNLGRRLPKDSVIDVHASGDQLTVVDVLCWNSRDVRALKLDERLSLFWFMPREFDRRFFFHEQNYSKLKEALSSPSITKIIFKPNFVSYPTNGNASVFNWLLMGAPEVDSTKPQNFLGRNASLSGSRPRGFGL